MTETGVVAKGRLLLLACPDTDEEQRSRTVRGSCEYEGGLRWWDMSLHVDLCVLWCSFVGSSGSEFHITSFSRIFGGITGV